MMRLRIRSLAPILPASILVLLVFAAVGDGRLSAADLEALANDPIGKPPAFEPVGEDRLAAAAGRLRQAIGTLGRWLDRSESGPGWRKYLDWTTLEQQAGSVDRADIDALAQLYQRFDSGADGLELPLFAAVRRSLGGYLEALGTARNPKADEVYSKRIERLAEAVAKTAAAGTPEPLEPVGPISARRSVARTCTSKSTRACWREPSTGPSTRRPASTTCCSARGCGVRGTPSVR